MDASDALVPSGLPGEEQRLFKVQASATTSQILPPPPTLPYDEAYPGLALNGPDGRARPSGSDQRDQVAQQVLDSAGRRPREAHKRLRSMGGYYAKGAARRKVSRTNGHSHGDETTVKREASEQPPHGRLNGHEDRSTPLERWHDDVRDTSRAASSTLDESMAPPPGSSAPPEDVTMNGGVEEGGTTVLATPLKAASQPSMAMGLRTSASKVPGSTLIHAGANDIDERNNEHCETCNGTGHFICCDGCPRSFHFACINPPMDIDELPATIDDDDDKWYCNECKASMSTAPLTKGPGKAQTNGHSAHPGMAKAKGKAGTMFIPLLRHVERTNPTIFSLPVEIRNYFKGVATAADGAYVDSTMLRPLKINKSGAIEARDPWRLKDKNGKLIVCYRCGESALPSTGSQDAVNGKGKETSSVPKRRSSTRPAAQAATEQLMSHSPKRGQGMANSANAGWRKIIGCDFCTLHWHLDCLDPPQAEMPSSSRKFMCPNHVDHVVRSERIPKSTANSTILHDLPVPSEESLSGDVRQYRTRVVNDGWIDIVPDVTDTYFGHQSGTNGTAGPEGSQPGTSTSNKKGGAGGGVGHDEHASMPLTATVSGSAENRGRGLDRGWEEMDIPLPASATTTRTSGPRTSGPSLPSRGLRFKYRIPEKVIRLDFWTRAEWEREQRQPVGRTNALSLDLLAAAAAAAAAADDAG